VEIQVFRVLIFVAAAAAIIFWASFIAGRWTWRMVRRRAVPLSLVSKAVLVLATIGIGCMVYGLLIEPYWPQVAHVELRTPKFPKGTQSIRVVHISDVHSDPVPRLETKLPPLIAAQKPDLIAITGDSANSADAAPVFQQFVRNLAAIAPTYAVRGNWDPPGSSARLFGETGVVELMGVPLRLSIKGTEISISGDPAESMSSVEAAFRLVPKDTFRLYLHHYPDRIYEVANEGVDLYLAGHTHGGQVALPLYGALITFSKYDKQFEWGLYKVQDTWLYVNRGIGMEGARAPRVRFWARPEITVIDIKPAD
jgi:uncharacterized protein